MILPLTYLSIGFSGNISRLDFPSDQKERFQAMGLIPGKTITLAHISPFNDPMVYKIDDNKLMLRRSEAERIYIDVSEIILNLSDCTTGNYTILSVNSGKLLENFLSSNGLYKGSKIEVIKNINGKIILKNNSSKITINKGKAKKILCKKL
ncbi:ferrous iron transport protein A [Oceanotoga sp. DSM 15011]|jgi:ferrous iron transport protein A|uniref:Ferrous iron transport protein A n=1 Tax=Oceanotoga teriensis TaxID=515440 RepID=A0AA45C6C5_9BACT|nr:MULTISPECIES: FeoA family protein [Oceanotoga]MDN5343094.1 ferrous iron transport protein [Oceanotoga sp.]MDO7977548.1 ferrous iron transport protein A [Oceanotoga teriensis]PWJ91232.1 ferrous iron transport protein A [Oceanotoga teriensis]UYO99707.1 ferrous iron transport protein A [Oceanotoga sp. DSM 15011]